MRRINELTKRALLSSYLIVILQAVLLVIIGITMYIHCNIMVTAFFIVIFLAVGIIAINKLNKRLIRPLNEMIDSFNKIDIEQDKKGEKEANSYAPASIEKIPEQLQELMELIESLNKDISIEDELKYMFSKFNKYVPYSYIGVALVKDNGKTLEGRYGIGNDEILKVISNISGKRYKIAFTSLGDVIEKQTPRIINDLEKYVSGKVSKPYNETILSSGIKASITLPLIVNEKPIGVIFFSSIHKNVYNEEHVMFLNIIAKSIAISFNKNMFVDNLLYSSILALAKLAEARDENTGEHLERMKLYSKLIAQLLSQESEYKNQISLSFVDEIEKFSPMHDIGKVGVRDSILLKPGKLSVEEYEEIKKHTIFGGKVLRAAEENILQSGISMFNIGIEIAEGHHEKWDGTGYPNGKRGQEIPMSARIVAVADVLDALTSVRPYKKAFPFEDALNYIVEKSGSQFDPEIIRVLQNNKKQIFNLYNSFSN